MNRHDLLTRVLPNAIASEAALLSALILSPAMVMAECAELSETDFYDLNHRKLWAVLSELASTQAAIDIATAMQAGGEELRVVFEKVLFDGGGLPSLAAEYVAAILAARIKRQMIELAHELTECSFLAEHDAEELQAAILAKLADIRTGRASVMPLSYYVGEASEDCSLLIGDERRVSGLDTGFTRLNTYTHGLHAGESWIVAGRPSTGKTSLATCIAANVAESGAGVALFSLEQSGLAIAKRMLAVRASVNMRKLRRLSVEAQGDLAQAALATARLPIWIDQRSGLTVAQIKAETRRLVAKHDVRLVVVDYLGLIRPSDRRKERYESVTEISAELKALAKELNVALLTLCQLSRKSAHEGRRPRLDDLRDTGAIEQDADVVILLSPDVEVSDLPESWRGEFNDDTVKQIVLCDVAKNREGDTGWAFLRFRKEFTRYENVEVRSQ